MHHTRSPKWNLIVSEICIQWNLYNQNLHSKETSVLRTLCLVPFIHCMQIHFRVQKTSTLCWSQCVTVPMNGSTV